MTDERFAVAGKQVDYGDFNHRVGAGLLAHRSASHADKDLCSQRRVVDAHIELKSLILRCSRHAFAHHINAVAHVFYVVDAVDFDDVSFVACEVGVSLDSCSHLVELVAVIELYVNHASVDACSQRNSHRQSGFDAFDGFNGNGVSHAHTRTEVGVGDAFGRTGLQESADNRVASRVPSCGDYRHFTRLDSRFVEAATEVGNLSVDVETVDGVHTQRQCFEGVFLHLARGRAKDGYVGIKFAEAAYYLIFTDFFGDVGNVASHDTRNFKVVGLFQGVEHVVTDVAVANDCCFYHIQQVL